MDKLIYQILSFGEEMVRDKAFKLITLLIFTLVILALSSYYIGQPLEVRKGAYFSEASLLMQPEKDEILLDEEFLVNVFLDTGQEKISAVKLNFNYDPDKLNFLGERVAGGLKIPISETVKIERDEENGLIGIARIAKEKTADLPQGSNLFTQVVFEPLTVGEAKLSVGDVELVGFNESLDESEPDVAFQVKGDKDVAVHITENLSNADVQVKITTKLKGVSNSQVSELPVSLKIGRGRKILKTYTDLTAKITKDGFLTLDTPLAGVEPGDDYFFLIKPAGALQRKICRNPQRDHCRLDGGEISLVEGTNSIDAEYDRIDMGNVNQDGVINSEDFSIIKSGLSSDDTKGDVDLNGVVNSRDVVIFLYSLSEIYDEDY